MRYLIPFLFLLGCAEPKPKPQQCYGPPVSFQGKQLVDCFNDKAGSTCCGYGYMPQGPRGQVCFHLVCQAAPCVDWMYHATKCYEQEPEEEPKQEVNVDPDSEEYENRGT